MCSYRTSSPTPLRDVPIRSASPGPDRSLTFAEVDARADRIAQALADHGLRHGDRVAPLAQNEIDHVEIQVAAQRAGLILVPLNVRPAGAELRAVLDDCEPKLLVRGPEYDEAAADLGSAAWGEAVHAIVVPRPGGKPDPAALIAHCRGRLAGYKTPKSVDVVDDLPKNASSKILKRAVRDRCWTRAERAVG